jgi:hypothetical protein
MSTGYAMRIASVFATHWRRSGGATGRSPFDFDLGKRPGRLDHLIEGQLPYVLVREEIAPTDLHFTGAYEINPAERITAAEVFIFALPFPADQVVAALRLDFDSPDLNRDSSLTRTMLASCADAEVTIGGRDLASYIDGLATTAKAEKEIPPGPRGKLTGLPLERHHLVFIGGLNGTVPPQDDVIKRILYGIEPPYRPEFTQLRRPDGLNQERDAYGAVSSTISFLYGHPDDVENSVFLTTVQAVGTASRFQQIWEDAYHQVQEFQTGKQAKQTGVQLRKDLETLADHMGNLELDLAFSVETAADLGLRIPSLSIDSFHHDLYEVMQIRTRAHTVSQMFIRLGGSIRSELTAIESRERQQEEERRLRAAIALGVVSILAAPLTFIIGFFGMNASQVHPASSIWSWHYYHWAYLTASLLAIAPIGAFVFMHGQALLRRRRQLREAAAEARRKAHPASYA